MCGLVSVSREERIVRRNSYVPGTIILNVCIQSNDGSINYFMYCGIPIQHFVPDNGGINSGIDKRYSHNVVIIFSIGTTTYTKLYKRCCKRSTRAFTGTGCTIDILT